MKHIRAFFARLPISFCGPAIIYPILFAAALVFAQMYKSAASYLLFIFVAALPIASALYLLAARLCIRASLRIPKRTVRKQTHLSIIADIDSRIPMVFPFAEAVILLPDEGGIRFEMSRFITSVLPFHSCTVSRSAFFALCGEYEICFSHMYVYDLTRSVRIRINVNKRESILVLPRSINLPTATPPSEGDSSKVSDGECIQGGHTEPIDVREYIAGDSLRRIHWKLSSKSDELFVREFSDGGNAVSFIFCDLEARHKNGNAPNTADLISCNAAVECAAVAAHRELDAKNSVCLSYVCDGAPMSVLLESHSDLYGLYRQFLSAKPSDVHEQIKLLLSTVKMPKNASVTVITPHPDTADSLTALLDGYVAEVMLCTQKGSPELSELTLPGIAVHQIFT